MKMIDEIPDQAWSRLAPLLDDALEHLPVRDRSALLLRYFEGKSLSETGRTLGLTDDAAQKRVSRATEKLRTYFAQRGVTTGSAALATILTSNAVRAAPPDLVNATAQLSLATVAALPVSAIFIHEIIAPFMKYKTVTALAGLALIALIVTRLWLPELNARATTRPPATAAVQSAANKTPQANPISLPNEIQLPSADAKFSTDHLSAKEVLDRMANVYGTCRTYLDSGLVKTVFIEKGGNRTEEINFRTVFVRPDRFRYESWQTVHEREHHFIVWSQGKDTQTYWDMPKPNIQTTTLSRGVARGTGATNGSAHTVPSLLLPDQLTGSRKLTDLIDVTRGKNEILDGTDCIRIKGLYGENELTLWLDKTTLLVRRIYTEADRSRVGFRTQTTTTYNPMLNGTIPDELLQFDPPEKSNAVVSAEQKK